MEDPKPLQSRDLYEMHLRESSLNNSESGSMPSARRQLRFSSVKQESPPQKGAVPEVPPFKIDMRSKQNYSSFHYDEQGMVSVRGEENEHPGTENEELGSGSAYFKALSS